MAGRRGLLSVLAVTLKRQAPAIPPAGACLHPGKEQIIMAQFPAGEIVTNGVTTPIFVDDRGKWEAEHAGRRLHHETRDKLEAALKRLTKQTTVPVEVPFLCVEKLDTRGIKFRRGVATGIHSANGNVLVTWKTSHGDVKEQLSHSGFQMVFLPGDTSEDDVKLLHQLVQDAARAANALREFERAHGITVKDEVLKAIENAAKSD